MEPVQAQITLKGATRAEVRAADFYGVPTEARVSLTGGAFSIDGRFQTNSYEVKW